MHQTSDTYKKILAGKHWVETVLQVGSNADVAVCWSIPGTVYGADMITKISQKGDILDREAPGIGYFVARKLEITMLDPGKQVAVMGRLVPYSRLVSDSGVSEWIPKGVFYVDTRKKAMVDTQAATVDIIGYDAGLKASIDYDGADLAWPATDVQVVADIAGEIESAYDVSNLNGGFTIAKPEEKTCCEVLRGIAALYGGNFTVDDCGVLRLLPLQTAGTPETVQTETLKMGPASAAITGVVIHDGEGNKYTAGDGEMLEAESPWASQAAAETALAAISGYRYQAFNAKQAIIKPHMQLGDYITAGTATGLMLSWNFNMDTYVGDVGAPEEYETNRKYPYRTAASRAGGVARAAKRLAKQAVGGIIENYNQLIAALNGKDGVPEDLASGLKNYVRYDLNNDEAYAQSTLFSKIGEKARSEIRTYVYVDADGERHALVDVIAKVDDAESGLATKVSTKDLRKELQNYALASSLSEYLKVTQAAELYVTGDGVKAIIGAYIVTDASGNQSTLAAILADVIKLQGDTEILGNLSIVNGRLNVSRSLQASTVFASGLTIESSVKYPIRVGSGYLGASTTAYFESDGITLGATKYSPQEITSTDGTEYTVLGST